MELSILLMEQIAKLFLMIFMGYAVVKLGLLTDEDSKVLSTLVLYLIVPSVILNAFQVDYTQEKVNGLKLAGIASLLLLIILLLIVNLIGKLLNLNEVEILSIYYSNSGNLIVPIVTFMLGEKWVFYACVFMGLQTFFSGHIAKMYSATRKDSIQKKFFPTLILLP
jgi:predicted permease